MEYADDELATLATIGTPAENPKPRGKSPSGPPAKTESRVRESYSKPKPAASAAA